MSVGDILEILPFEDPIIVIELDGAAIWDALEASLETWPAQEGSDHFMHLNTYRSTVLRRFPVISGFRVSWDSRRSPGERVIGIWLLNEVEDSESGHTSVSGHSTPRLVDGAPIQRTTDKTYKMVTRQYMAEGHDGFVALKRGKHIIDDEAGSTFSTFVRKYLMGKIRLSAGSVGLMKIPGSHYVNAMARRAPADVVNLHPTAKSAIVREKARQEREQHRSQHGTITAQWKHAAHLALRWSRSRTHYQEHLNVCTLENMSSVDPFDGEKMRGGQHLAGHRVLDENDLLTISPEVDGRLKDEGR